MKAKTRRAIAHHKSPSRNRPNTIPTTHGIIVPKANRKCFGHSGLTRKRSERTCSTYPATIPNRKPYTLKFPSTCLLYSSCDRNASPTRYRAMTDRTRRWGPPVLKPKDPARNRPASLLSEASPEERDNRCASLPELANSSAGNCDLALVTQLPRLHCLQPSYRPPFRRKPLQASDGIHQPWDP